MPKSPGWKRPRPSGVSTWSNWTASATTNRPDHGLGRPSGWGRKAVAAAEGPIGHADRSPHAPIRSLPPAITTRPRDRPHRRRRPLQLADEGDPQAMSLRGGLTLQRAVIGSRMNDPETAYGQLERASQIAAVLGEGRNRLQHRIRPGQRGCCMRTRSPSSWAMRAARGSHGWTPPGCQPSGGPGCSSTWPAPMRSAARFTRRSQCSARPRRSLPNKSATAT